MATGGEHQDLLKDAALVVDVCMSVEEGDVVTIICDDDREDRPARRRGRASSAAAGR